MIENKQGIKYIQTLPAPTGATKNIGIGEIYSI